MDAAVIRFTTELFDVTKERPNDINPIYGESLLLWLAEKLKGHVEVPKPQTEDWGWYVDVEAAGANYLVGASGDAENSTSEIEWIVQVHKHRSLKEKILGQNKMAVDDPLVALIESIVRADPQISEVSIDRNA